MDVDIAFLGEPLIEFNQRSPSHPQDYLRGYGGDTSNATIAAARQGASCRYITHIGDDTFGKDLMELWSKEGVDTDHVGINGHSHTGIYFVAHGQHEHTFTYMRKGSAASLMAPDDIIDEAISSAKVLHISGISQAISETACDAVFRAIEVARSNNVLVSYDTNLRTKLWPLDRARAIIGATIPMADIILPSFEDAIALTRIEDPQKIVEHYLSFGAKVVVLKCGEKGAIVGSESGIVDVPPYKVDSVDATGAGDCFDGAFLARLIAEDDYYKAALYANCAAALSTTGYGAVDPIPFSKAVTTLL